MLGFRRCDGADTPPGEVRGQLRRAFEEGSRGWQATAGLGAGSRPLKLGRDVLIRFVGRRGAMPGEPVGVGDGIGDVRQRGVHPAAFLW